MANFVLIHGSWHDGSAWQPTLDHLRKKGHTAVAPTIAGHGKGVNKRVNHADCVRSILEYIAGNSLKDIVLVGHSFGGTIISKVVEAIPERIRRLVFVNGFVVRDGNSLTDEIPPVFGALFAELARNSEDQTVMLPFQIWRETFINDADM